MGREIKVKAQWQEFSHVKRPNGQHEGYEWLNFGKPEELRASISDTRLTVFLKQGGRVYHSRRLAIHNRGFTTYMYNSTRIVFTIPDDVPLN